MGLSVNVEHKKGRKKFSYPYIGYSSDYVVLFTKKDTGILLQDMSNCGALEKFSFDDDWNEDVFNPLIGKIEFVQD